MSSGKVLLEQFSAVYDENKWFVSLKGAIDGVSADQAAWKPANVDISIWESVNHLIFWNEQWLKRFRGELNEPQEVENTGTFKSNETDWENTITKLDAVMNEWREKLAAIDNAKLESSIAEFYKFPWRSPLAQQNIHNAYHIGQIVLLRKLQGSWDAKKGVS